MENFRKALVSNKEDTGALLVLLGELQEKVDAEQEVMASVEKRMHRSGIVANIVVPTAVASGALIGIGTYMLCNGTDTGKYFLFTGLGLFGGVELTWNLGHFAFKIW